jgi:hypothetical protein
MIRMDLKWILGGTKLGWNFNLQTLSSSGRKVGEEDKR